MSSLENRAAWPDATTVHDMIQHFPLPIALLDGAGGVLVLNEGFEQTFGAEVLDSAPLQDLIEKAVPGWESVQVTGRGQGQIEVQAQVTRVRDNVMLVLDGAADPEFRRELDELQVQNAQLERLSSIDSLTGSWNRAHFDRVAASELERSIRFKQPVSLIFLDIYHFKQINDAHGHQAGDAVLCELVQVIGVAVRSSDMLFRWGGEEFLILAPSTGYRSGAVVAARIRDGVEQHRFEGVGRVTISVGVAEHLEAESVEVWFRRADEALYRAKHDGRNRVSVDQRGSSDVWAAESGPSVVRLVWQEAYECGQPTIDDQHRELFELANTLFDASFKSETSPEVFVAALDKLLAHIARHFADEEAILAQYGYKELKQHQLIHAGLMARAGELKTAVLASKTTLGDLVEFVATIVIAHHLFKEDRKFFPLFKKQLEK